MTPRPETEPTLDESDDLLPRWMKSVVARKVEGMPALPFQRACKRHPGLLPAQRQRTPAIAAR